MTTDTTWPMDYDAFHKLWEAWLDNQDFTDTNRRFPGTNFMADEVLDTVAYAGFLIEFSRVRFLDTCSVGITYAKFAHPDKRLPAGPFHTVTELDNWLATLTEETP